MIFRAGGAEGWGTAVEGAGCATGLDDCAIDGVVEGCAAEDIGILRDICTVGAGGRTGVEDVLAL